MIRRRPLKIYATLLMCSFGLRLATAQAGHWVGTWASAQQLPEPSNSLAPNDLRDATLREVVHVSLGGEMVRVRLSNAFGSKPLHLLAVHIARTKLMAGSIDIMTDSALKFGGEPDVTVPAGAEYISDPIPFPVAALSDLVVTLRFGEPPAQETAHASANATSFLVHGERVSAERLPGARRIGQWYQISGVDVLAPAQAAAIVALGDSITDGDRSTQDGNNRWPDLLARRLHTDSRLSQTGVLNQGINGNGLLLDYIGPNALARFDRDVLAQPGVRFVIVLEGINDIGRLTLERDVPASDHAALVHGIISSYQQIAARAHAHGIRVIGATMLPFEGSLYHPGPASEADRQTVNRWILHTRDFDAAIDFDAVMRDAGHPSRLSPALDSGDHIHPSPAGYKAMADAIPLTLFLH